MNTEVLSVTDASLRLAAKLIRAGDVVAFGTETVYGLGADARNADAVKRVFEAKGRPTDNPLIVHLSRVEDMPSVCEVSTDLLEKLKRIMPAPLTVILPKRADIPCEVTAGLDSVGVRVPKSEGARAFIAACGVPIAAPSANTSTRPSPTTAQHVYDDLNGKIRLILDMGDCEIGVESTVVDMTCGTPRVLRLGGMTVESLTGIFGAVEVPEIKSADKPLSPGMKYRHYAPSVPVKLLDVGDISGAKSIFDRDKTLRPVVAAIEPVLDAFSGYPVHNLGRDDRDAAHNLFSALRSLEKEYGEIITFKFPDTGYGRAVNNRLIKASGGK